MRSVYQFSPVWESRDSRHLHNATGKRRRSPSSSDDDETGEDESDQGEIDEYRQRVTTTQGKKDQFYVAGLDPEHSSPPPPPFPHGYKARDRRRNRDSKTENQDHAPSLRQQHLATMTSILHTSLLKGDYVRAGRAWGMLLRSSTAGKAVDLRSNGRWGIGAEILLRRDMPSRSLDDIPDHESSTDKRVRPAHVKDSFQAAKDYYEQLILQYPYQRHLPHTINALTFYPSMFGLMIYEAVEMTKQAMAETENSTSGPSSPDASGSDHENPQRTKVADVKRTELDSAQTIAARLDETLLTPPYDKYVPLLRLRAMVGQWIADLYDDIITLHHEAENDDADSVEPSLQGYATRQENDLMASRAEAERQKARLYIRKIVDGGDQVPKNVKDMV